MNKPAHDVDQLMWVLAEHRDMKAVEEFEQRFPELRLELAKRVAMVNGLRSAREETPPIPRFRAPVPQRTFWHRPMAVSLAAGVLLAMAFGAYLGTSAIMESRATREADPVAVMPAVGVGESQTPKPFTVEAPPQDIPRVTQPDPVALENLEDFKKPHSVKIDQASLLVVLEAIGMQTGLEIEMAPGMPDFSVSVHYEGMTGLQMIQDLGRRYQFTALTQGRNKVLVVPAVAPGNGDREPSQPTRGVG